MTTESFAAVARDLAASAPVEQLIRLALAEDLGSGDVTTSILVPPDLEARAVITAREAGVVCGLPIAARVPELAGVRARLAAAVEEGSAVAPGQPIAHMSGSAAGMLATERLVLNLIQRLSGIASTTRSYVRSAGDHCAVLETRKTVPGWRTLDKYAVRAGGGQNHRLGLFDQILAKENHFALARRAGIAAEFRDAIRLLVERRPLGMPVEVEVETMEEFAAALDAGVDVIMLDEMAAETMRRAVAMRDARRAAGDPAPLLEASGGITLETVAMVAATGVDRMSVGALTHSVRSLDVSMRIEAS